MGNKIEKPTAWVCAPGSGLRPAPSPGETWEVNLKLNPAQKS